MASAKFRSLTTRAYQSSDLSFEVAGVIDWQNTKVQVGERLAINQIVSSEEMRAAIGQRRQDIRKSVIYDAKEIGSQFGSKAAFRLKNYHEQVEVAQVIANRDIQFLRAYRDPGRLAKLIAEATKDGALSATNALKGRDEMFAELQKVYQAEPADSPWKGVRRAFATEQTATGESVSDLYLAPTGTLNPPTVSTSVPEGPTGSKQTSTGGTMTPMIHDAKANQWVPVDTNTAAATRNSVPAFYAQRSVSKEDKQNRKSVSQSASLWHPQLESVVDFHRDRDELVRLKLNRNLAEIGVEHLQAILEREAELLELDVLRSQNRLLSTYLFVPYECLVTAIYKDVGEHVQAGEPVLRVENDRRVFLFGHILYRGRIGVGTKLVITARNIYQLRKDLTVSGLVTAVRGHSADDDEWEILVELDRREDLPLNFSFDPTDTKLEVV